ncbi:uncharacterized protein [Macrobrachium rosenbergii]
MSDSVPEVPSEDMVPPQNSDSQGRRASSASPPLQPEPEVEREPPILFRDDMDVSTGMDDDKCDSGFGVWSQVHDDAAAVVPSPPPPPLLLPPSRSRSVSPCLSLSSASSCSDLYSGSSSNSSYSSPLFFYSSSSSSSSLSSLSTSCSSLSDASSSSSHSSAKYSVSSSRSSKSGDSDINNNNDNNNNQSDKPSVKNLSPPPPPQTISPATNPAPPDPLPVITSSSTPPSRAKRRSSTSGLSRSSTASSDISMSSSTSGLSFGSSYYVLYVVDPAGRVPTPQELPSSPEGSPSPPAVSRCNSAASISSVDTMRTVTPDQQYFEINNAAFRRMQGMISRASSYESCLTFQSNRSRSHSLDSSCSTLQFNSLSQELPACKHFNLSPIPSSSQSAAASPRTQSQPASPIPHYPIPSRACSFESITSFLRRIPRAPSSVRSISTFDLAPMSQSASPVPRGDAHPDRPPSTDSPVMLASPSGSLRGSQESVVVYRPVPRYNDIDPGSPEPQSALLCYLGPARPYEPPVVFADVARQVKKDFDGLVASCAQLLSPEEREHLEELRQYMLDDEGSWALGENFNILFHRIFHDPSIPDESRLHLVRIMAAAALKDDVILLLHQDRKEHTIMNYANKVESLPPSHQESLALFFCNMFEHLSPSEWLLYISEWQDGSQQASNIRVTTKVAVNALLHSNSKVQDYGTALMYNLGTKEVKTVVFDDVAPELAMAILQFFNSHPPEELLWRTMTALCRFCYSSTEVPALIKMIGPEPSVFKGVSERIDNVIEEIDAKLSRVRLF